MQGEEDKYIETHNNLDIFSCLYLHRQLTSICPM